MKTHEQIITSFREKFKDKHWDSPMITMQFANNTYVGTKRQFIESFILDILKERDREVREMIEGIRIDKLGMESAPFFGTGVARAHARSWNAALDELLTKLQAKL